MGGSKFKRGTGLTTRRGLKTARGLIPLSTVHPHHLPRPLCPTLLRLRPTPPFRDVTFFASRVSVIAASPTDSSEMQVDEPLAPPADADPIAETPGDQAEPVPRCGPLRSSRQSVASTPSRSSRTHKIRPLIKLKTSQKSVTPPASEAFNEEGKDELNDEEEAPRPSKRRRSSSRAATGQAQGKGKGKEQSEPTFDAGCSNCIFRNRDCEHGKPGVLCDHCKKGHLSHCTHTFTVPEHVQAANHIELYANLSNQLGNELLLGLSSARIDYELARDHFADGLPGMDEIPEELQPLWGQLLLDSQAQMTIDYHAAIMQYRS
ncbi:hypothetical protein B0H14DRAFT_3537073 [Mycena olivaceomarginata]|nr:hypothetical protein B0H14DRAFT_3537073 [Mycena olivaceomarginata]